MIELRSSNTYNQPSDLLLEFNKFTAPTSVNRSDLYAPHTSTYASRDMSYNRNLNYTNENDDIYDFDSTVGNQMILRPNEVTGPSVYNYTDEDEDEEDDINFDYEYGYDYERVIKDRLAKVNQDFVNDSEPPKRKSILVSFDAAVTAIDIPIEEQKRQTEINFVSPEEKMRFKAAVSEADLEDNNVIKLPLNDTIQKEDPDHFANQVRIRNSMYDAQVLELQQNGELNTENVNMFRSGDYSRQETNKTNDDKTIPSDLFQLNNEFKSSTPSPPPYENKSNVTNDNIKMDNIDKSKKLIDNYENSDWSDSKTSKPKKGDSSTQSLKKKPIAQLTDSNTNHKNDQSQLKIQQHELLKNNNRIISFSSESRPSANSPSPISSLRSTPEPKISSSHPKITNVKNSEPNNYQNSSIPENVQDTLDKTLTDSEHNSYHDVASSNLKKDSAERILIEKDGIFKLMTTEEHTAYEKQKKIEQQQQEQKQQNRSLNSSINSNKSSNQVATTVIAKQPQASPIKILPHPPPRGNSVNKKTDNNPVKARPRSSYISGESGFHANSLRTRFEQFQKDASNQSSQRSGVSVDSKARRSTSARNRKTPEYAQGYKSPYQQTCKIVKVGESTADRLKREKEEREKKEMNEMAFKAWLKMKEEQHQMEMRRLKKIGTSNETSGNGTIITLHSEDKVSFEAWLAKKNQQLINEKDFKKTLDEYQLNENSRRQTPEERNRVFKEWLQKKNKEKAEQTKQEKLEMKKWASKRRRSRKHQRLSQALELAQAYGYNSSFRSPGPFSY